MMRAAIQDRRARPRRNLAINPRLRRGVAGSAVVRRNLAVDPQGSRAGVGFGFAERWAGSGGSQTVATITGVTDGPLEGITRYARKTWTAVGQANDISFAISRGGRVLLVPGRTYTLSVYWRASWNTFISSTFQNNIRVIQYDTQTSTGTLPSVTVQSAHLSAPVPGTWQRQSITITVTAERPWVEAYHNLFASLPAVGSTLEATALLVEERPALLPYFDASTAALAPGFTLAWEGNALTSPSQMRGQIVECRRNFFPNPAASGTTGFTTTSGQFQVSHTGSAVRFTAQGTSASGTGISGFEPAIGTNYRLLIRARANRSLSATMRVRGGQSGSVTIGTEWAWFDTTAVAASGTSAQTGFLFSNNVLTAGDWVEVDRVLIAVASDYGPWFGGADTPDADLTPQWVGAADASESQLVGAQVAHVAAAPGGGRVVIYSHRYEGCYPYSFFDNSATMSTGAVISGSLFTLEVGKTYTVIAKLFLPSPTTGSGNGIRRMYTLAGVDGMSPYAPNVAGTHELRMTFTCTSTNNSFRLGQGDRADVTVWKDIVIVEGEYDGPYFDGDSPGCQWSGLAHQSSSVGYSLAA